jgi:hypothetical protein
MCKTILLYRHTLDHHYYYSIHPLPLVTLLALMHKQTLQSLKALRHPPMKLVQALQTSFTFRSNRWMRFCDVQTVPSLGLVPEVDDDQPEHYGGEGGGCRLDQAKHWPPRMVSTFLVATRTPNMICVRPGWVRSSSHSLIHQSRD